VLASTADFDPYPDTSQSGYLRSSGFQSLRPTHREAQEAFSNLQGALIGASRPRHELKHLRVEKHNTRIDREFGLYARKDGTGLLKSVQDIANK
jgi:hypothetical protein